MRWRSHKAPQSPALAVGRAHAGRGLIPEVEKPGLLPPRLDDAGLEDGIRSSCARRPARGMPGPTASDLAVTVGLRPGRHGAGAMLLLTAAADYETRKSSHLSVPGLGDLSAAGERQGCAASNP